MKGISIIVCCFNSKNKLPETLAHIAAQKINNAQAIEVIIVDNNSSNHTLHFAEECWKSLNQPFKAFFLLEPNEGLTHARRKGVEQANYDYLIFCDDDNWLDQTYSETVYNHFESETDVAIIGGIGEAVFETKKPFWFDQFYHGYAVGKQAPKTQYLNSVYGAGMGIRKEIIKSKEFTSIPLLLSDRKGVSLSSGGDAEICLRIRLLGYKVLFSEQLTFKHFLTEGRLNWAYLIKLHDGFTAAYIPLHLYELVMNKQAVGNFYWLQQSILNLGRWIKYSFVYFSKITGNSEGNAEVIRLKGWQMIGFDFLKYNFITMKLYKTIKTIKQHD